MTANEIVKSSLFKFVVLKVALVVALTAAARWAAKNS